MKNVLLVGMGHIGNVYIQAIENSSSYNLVGICDINAQYKVFADEAGVDFSDSLTDLATRNEAQIAIIATATESHYDLSREAIYLNLDVWIEKPPFLKTELFDELIELAKTAGKSVVFCFHARMGSECLYFYRELEQFLSRYGPITGIDCAFYDPYLSTPDKYKQVNSLINPWIDSAPNALSVIGGLVDLSSLIPISAIATRDQIAFFEPISSQKPMSEARVGFIESSNGIPVSISTAWNRNISSKQTKIFFGKTEVCMLIDHSAQALIISGENTDACVAFQGSGSRLQNHYDNLLRTVNSSGLCISVEEARTITGLIEKVNWVDIDNYPHA